MLVRALVLVGVNRRGSRSGLTPWGLGSRVYGLGFLFTSNIPSFPEILSCFLLELDSFYLYLVSSAAVFLPQMSYLFL